MENTIRLDLNETPCNSDDEDGNCKSTEAENGGGVMSENSIDDVVSLDNMDEAAVDNMLNASMENMAEAAVDNMAEPAVDMCFVTGEEFAVFCHDYAYRKGFTFYTRTTELMKEYKEMGVGRTAAGLKEPMYHMMKVIRLNCKYGGKKQTNGSIVTGCPCQLEHNHCLSPKDSRFMVNYRSIDDPTAGKITNNDQAGISIAKSYNSLLVESGGHENITYNQRDVRNVVHLNRRKSRLEGDAVALEKYFQQQYEYNQEFYSAIERDDDGRLMNAFWSDARSRAMHKDFGDIITFDTTFLCNRYRMPFAPFVGVSHHGKSIVFAAALLSHEDTETFVWVFNQWLKCMGNPPKGILTDQCKAIGKAVETVFVGVPHRLCLWHILQNASRNLGKLSKWKEIEEALRNVVHDTLDPDEFDEAWGLMVEKFGIHDNAWLKETYEIRGRWAPAYWRSTFWAGMSSTQRSEGINRFFKGFVSIETGLLQFIRQYEAALKGKVEEEKLLNFNSTHKPPICDKDMIVQYVFQKAYTNTKFLEVKAECDALKLVSESKTASLGGLSVYQAVEKFPKPVWKKRWKTFIVSCDKDKGDFSCSCKLFEFRGILCRHIIKIIEFEDVNVIPERYILSRWRKDIVRPYEDIRVSYYDPEEFDRVKRVRELSQRHCYLSSLALHSDETFL
ncbi:Protein FAR1-RELATED SEQUENCE 5, partial [Bienertia sinuspersici]